MKRRGERAIVTGVKSSKIGLRLALALGLVAVACNPVMVTPVHVLRAPVIFGISIPIPPPSLTAAPQQDAHVAGEIDPDEPLTDAVVYLHDTVSGNGYFLELGADTQFEFSDVSLDLTNNCLEVHYEQEGEDGDLVSEVAFYRAGIGADDQSVDLTEVDSCD
ncbi:MAG: hypothetical protein KC636_33300 [Myxococcales bacterium]|nr:hypothetical protein [Myxococcales bacterium]